MDMNNLPTSLQQLGNMSVEYMLDMFRENMVPVESFFANYRCAIMEIETKFNVLNERFSIKYDDNPIESIKSRVQELESLIKKGMKKNIPITLESIEKNIKDIAGVRVICSFEQDIYTLAEQFLEQDDITLLEKKDYIKEPKPNGYRSLHLIVSVPIFTEEGKKDIPVEVQLRTIAMDFWASLEHKMRYKKNISREMQAELADKLHSCATDSAELDKSMQEIRNSLLENKE